MANCTSFYYSRTESSISATSLTAFSKSSLSHISVNMVMCLASRLPGQRKLQDPKDTHSFNSDIPRSPKLWVIQWTAICFWGKCYLHTPCLQIKRIPLLILVLIFTSSLTGKGCSFKPKIRYHSQLFSPKLKKKLLFWFTNCSSTRTIEETSLKS